MRKVLHMSRWDNAYLISHLGTGVNVKAQVVVGQLGGLFLQLPGESDLPAAGNTQTQLLRYCKKGSGDMLSETAHMHLVWCYCSLQWRLTSAPLDMPHCSVRVLILRWSIIIFAIYTVTWASNKCTTWFTGGFSFCISCLWQLMPSNLHLSFN